MPRRVIWELLLLISGVVYVLLVLLDYLQSPAFAAAFVLLGTEELVHAHRRKP